MELKRYQWVGLLAGFPLFSGAWLSGFYNTPWPGVIGLLVTVAALFIANHVETRSDRNQHMLQGAVAGLLAGLAARVLGLIAGWMVGLDQMVQFSSLDDLFRVVLAGDWLASLALILGLGITGAVIGAVEPEAVAKGRKK